MRTGPFAIVGLVAAGLAAVIAFELDSSDDMREDPALPVVIRRAPVGPAHARAVSVPVDRTDEWAAGILARPLFSRDRRPAPAVAPSGPSGPAETDGLPRLTGVMVGPFGRSAIFAAVEGGKPTVVSEGSSVGGYTVSSIGPGEVTVDGPDGSKVLRPVFDPNAPRRDPAVSAAPGGAPAPGQPGAPGTPGMPRPRNDNGVRLPIGGVQNPGPLPDDTTQAPTQ